MRLVNGSCFTVSLCSLLSLVAAPACVETEEPPAAGACPAPEDMTGPTLHAWSLQGDEVWSAAEGPHVVRGVLAIPEGATLIIEPCAQVLFEADAGLAAELPGARLEIRGEPGREVRLQPQGAARWGDVLVAAPASAEIRHAVISGGGADPTHGNATLVVRGTYDIPTAQPLKVEHVVVEDSAGPGLVAEFAAGFADGSDALTIRGSGQAGGLPYPLVIGEHTLRSLPAGSYTGNGRDEILVREENAGTFSGLQEDTTVRDLGVPYRTDAESSLRVGAGGERAPRVTLTLEAGVTFRFAEGTGIFVHEQVAPDASSGVLRALGTAERPVVLTSAADDPAPGDWRGIWFDGQVDPETLLERVELAYTGGWCGCSLVSCNEVESYEAAIVLQRPPGHAFLVDSTIRDGAGHGIVRSWDGDPGPDLSAGNTITGLAGCAQTLPRAEDGTCPDPRPVCE